MKNSCELPPENEEAQALRVRETFNVLDVNKDKRIDADDLKKILKKIGAPKLYTDNAQDIIWEVCDNHKPYLDKKLLEAVVRRVTLDQRSGQMREPSRLVDVLDFVSKDMDLTGNISARQCILLLHNRFGGVVSSVELRNLFVNNHTAGSSRINFSAFVKQIAIRQALKN
jgi:Ca2+-binding EF-hand superfamily protein